MVKKILVIVVCTFIIHSYGCNESKSECDNYDNFFSKNLLKNHSDTLQLIKTLDSISHFDRKCIGLYLTIGDLSFGIDKVMKAENCYKYVLSLDSNNIYALYQLGVISNYLNKYEIAIEMFQKALNLKTSGGFVYDYPNNGSLPNDKAKFDVDSKELMFVLGLAYYYKRELRSAYENFTYCIQNEYKLKQAYLYRAAVLLEMRNNQGDPCSDLRQSQLLGNLAAATYIDKYCK